MSASRCSRCDHSRSGGQALAVMGEPYDITTNSAGKSLCGLGESASIS
jgi:hypothetical protein